MAPKKRASTVERVTKETQIAVTLGLDGKGSYRGSCGIHFLDHMLDLFAKHGHFDLIVHAKGDLHIDDHHLVEDLGITLGQAFAKAIGDRKGIVRYGSIVLPMDEALSYVAIDISGRSHITYHVPIKDRMAGKFNLLLVDHFFESFVAHAKLTLHIDLRAGKYGHHIIESVFKGFARALSQAVSRDKRVKGIPSTKGKL